MSGVRERRKQCAKCPWKVSTDPRAIPNGYSVDKHRAAACTIAEPAALRSGPLRLMACHETANAPCVGWLHNQLGPGNNIALRLAVMTGRVSGDCETEGPQHECFEDTLPRRGPEA